MHADNIVGFYQPFLTYLNHFHLSLVEVPPGL